MSTYVEDCYHLTPRKLKKTLGHAGAQISAIERERPDIQSWMDEGMLCIAVGGKDPQRIEIETVANHLGTRTYLLCPMCGYRAHKLYLPPQGHNFACRTCHKLKYRLSTINKYSSIGGLMYALSHQEKLMTQRESLRSIVYNGNFTRKFQAYVKQARRHGSKEAMANIEKLTEILREANKLKDLDRV